jgi:hypothetical protein
LGKGEGALEGENILILRVNLVVDKQFYLIPLKSQQMLPKLAKTFDNTNADERRLL